MKKVLMLVMTLLVLTACGSSKTLEIKDEETGYNAVFKLSENDDYVIEDINKIEGSFTEYLVTSKSLNIKSNIYFYEIGKTVYQDNKDYRKNQDGFSEYKFNKKEAYLYYDTENSFQLNIILKEKDEKYIVLYIYTTINDKDQETNIKDIINNKSFKKMLNTIDFKIEK